MNRTLVLASLLCVACDDASSLFETDAGDVDGTVADAAIDAARDAEIDAAPLPRPEPGERPLFAFPIHPDDRHLLRDTLILGVDHDPAIMGGIQCLDYQGRRFPFCYDEHDGTDYLLTGGFDAMDRGSARIVAAAGGVVTYAIDGNYDRCSGSVMGGIDCDGNEMLANAVEITHVNGYISRYWHMKRDSVAVAEGDVVNCGDFLGLVGSSGISAQPHLHFEVMDDRREAIDPYAGDLSQPESYWHQPAPSGDTPIEQVLPGPACAPAWTRGFAD
jgi:murein DD-endopeptidase MepM/ murein hydrolase activator NlpD